MDTQQDPQIIALCYAVIKCNGTYDTKQHYKRYPFKLSPNQPKGYSYTIHTFTIPCHTTRITIDGSHFTMEQCKHVMITIDDGLVTIATTNDRMTHAIRLEYTYTTVVVRKHEIVITDKRRTVIAQC